MSFHDVTMTSHDDAVTNVTDTVTDNTVTDDTVTDDTVTDDTVTDDALNDNTITTIQSLTCQPSQKCVTDLSAVTKVCH